MELQKVRFWLATRDIPNDVRDVLYRTEHALAGFTARVEAAERWKEIASERMKGWNEATAAAQAAEQALAAMKQELPFNLHDELHAVLTVHGIHSRSTDCALVTDLLSFFARAARQTTSCQRLSELEGVLARLRTQQLPLMDAAEAYLAYLNSDRSLADQAFATLKGRIVTLACTLAEEWRRALAAAGATQ